MTRLLLASLVLALIGCATSPRHQWERQHAREIWLWCLEADSSEVEEWRTK